MKIYRIALVLIVCLFTIALGGCSTAPGMTSLVRQHTDLEDFNPQNYQGCTVVRYEESAEIEPIGKTVIWYDCKDKADVLAQVDLNSDGEIDFTYDATDVVGSDAASIRAEVERVFAEQGASVTPEVVNGIVDAVLGL